MTKLTRLVLTVKSKSTSRLGFPTLNSDTNFQNNTSKISLEANLTCVQGIWLCDRALTTVVLKVLLLACVSTGNNENSAERTLRSLLRWNKSKSQWWKYDHVENIRRWQHRKVAWRSAVPSIVSYRLTLFCNPVWIFRQPREFLHFLGILWKWVTFSKSFSVLLRQSKGTLELLIIHIPLRQGIKHLFEKNLNFDVKQCRV